MLGSIARWHVILESLACTDLRFAQAVYASYPPSCFGLIFSLPNHECLARRVQLVRL